MTGLRALTIEKAALPTPNWVGEALCGSVDPELFFDRGQETTAQSNIDKIGNANRLRREAAKRVCDHCPVLLKCREHYINEEHGVFGGLDRDERRALRRARSVIQRADAIGDDVAREALQLQLEGKPLSAVAKQYGLRLGQLRVHLDSFALSPAGQRVQLEHAIRRAHDEGLDDLQIAIKLRLDVAKVRRIKAVLGLVERRVSAAPAMVGDAFYDSSVNVMGATLQATYLGESTDGWLFMQVKYPHGGTRKWMAAEQVTLGPSVRRHVIAKGVGSGQKRKRDTEDQGQVA